MIKDDKEIATKAIIDNNDCTSKQAAVEAVAKFFAAHDGGNMEWWMPVAHSIIDGLPSVKPKTCIDCQWKSGTTERCGECLDGVFDNYEPIEECDDTISRLDFINKIQSEITRNNDDDEFNEGLRTAGVIAYQLPSVTPSILQAARDIAAITKNEQDMRVIRQNAKIDELEHKNDELERKNSILMRLINEILEEQRKSDYAVSREAVRDIIINEYDNCGEGNMPGYHDVLLDQLYRLPPVTLALPEDRCSECAARRWREVSRNDNSEM